MRGFSIECIEGFILRCHFPRLIRFCSVQKRFTDTVILVRKVFCLRRVTWRRFLSPSLLSEKKITIFQLVPITINAVNSARSIFITELVLRRKTDFLQPVQNEPYAICFISIPKRIWIKKLLGAPLKLFKKNSATL